MEGHRTRAAAVQVDGWRSEALETRGPRVLIPAFVAHRALCAEEDALPDLRVAVEGVASASGA